MTIYRIIHQDISIEIPKGEFLIGRSDECHLVLDDPSISRVHAAIILSDDELYVEDRGSRNGVIVNFAHIEKRTRLMDGDSVTLGQQTIRVISIDRIDSVKHTLRIDRDDWKIEDNTDPSIVQQQPIILMAGLATKAIRVNKLDEAERMVPNLLNIAQKKSRSSQTLSNAELAAISEMIIALAEASKNPQQISRLLGFHLAIERLMSRELVDKLFNVVRVVNYRACPQFARYLALLASREAKLNPSEKFILRRLEGLAKLCN
jgi:pSer/pThr/pTyr-binding forkhead associated (FHA) protein